MAMSDSDEEYEPEYEPEEFTLANKYKLRVLAVVPPPIEYMSTLHSQQQEISGRQVWTGSSLLAHALIHVIEHQDGKYFENKRILELGSGTGLVGMLASKLDTTCQVALTDGDAEAMRLLDLNLEDPYNAIDTIRVHTKFLRWNENMEQFDEWMKESLGGHQVDVILAGDVMYKKELPPLFFQTVQRYLDPSGGTLWLCHVPRSTVTHKVVLDAAADAALKVEAVDTSNLEIEHCPLEDLKRATVYKITR